MTTMQATAFRQMQHQRAITPDRAPDDVHEDAEIDSLVDPILVFRIALVFFVGSIIAATIHAMIA